MPYEILLQHISIVPCLCVFGISHFGLYYLYSSTNLKSFFDTIIEIDVGQTIVAITIEDSDTKEAIAALNPDSYNIIRIKKRAFVKMSEENEVE